MKQLWAPWRMKFILGSRRGECIFCSKPKENRDRENFIVHRGKKVFVMLNIFPYNNGHLMISPYRHVTNVEDLSEDESMELFELLKRSVAALKISMKPTGFNIGMNVGKASGAGFEHLHMQVVPRWAGDTNYMPVLAEVKVISEHLEESYNTLLKSFAATRD